jgi:hypothetical protein
MNNAALKVLKPDPPYLYLIRQAVHKAAATGMSEHEILEMTRRLIREKNGGNIK